MEEIKILFFIIGTFFGIDQSNIIAENTIVTINSEEKTIIIIHQNLISIIQNESDSLKVQNELTKITRPNQPWKTEFKNYTKKEKCFYVSEDSKSLNSKITLNYSTNADLKAFGIDVNNDGKFSMMNFPKSHITSTEGKLSERYWNFEANQPFSFTLAPLTDIPEAYKIYKKNLLPYWQTIKY